jgi:aryl-alcohol dehydrogenase-like predicted oxidoreductase
MLVRRLGRTGYRISEIGFGAWGLGATMWRGVDDAEGARTLHQALDLGVSFVDTALAYGEGHSEKLIAGVLRERGDRDGIVVATKVPPKDYAWPAKAKSSLSSVFPKRWVAECVEQSLRNLRVEALAVEQFHVWHDDFIEQAEWDHVRHTMERLVQEGKVLHWGVSVNDHQPETAFRLLDDPLIETVQAIYNIYDRSPERGLFEKVRANDLGLIVRVPLDEGALTGAVRKDTKFPVGDWRHRYFAGDRKAEAERRATALVPLLGPEAGSLPELALRFVLSRSEVATVIPGMRRPEHARSNAAVSDGRGLSPAMLDRLGEHAWEKNWYGS